MIPDTDTIASVRKEDGEWVVFCHRCGQYVSPRILEIGSRDWLTQTSAATGAFDHARREHWTPEVAR